MNDGRFMFGKWRRTSALAALALLWLSSAAQGQEASGQESLPRLAEVGPWPAVSRLIGYGGRLWLANSVKGRNHNSADVYSFDPATGDLRYERHLFSQDAGQPLVADGLLYWPFEDGRVSLGWGDFMVTDGARWRLATLPSAEIFHVHALARVGGRLLAATSAWRAGLQVSADDGQSWRALYDHPTPERRVSRITDLIEVNERALAYLSSRDRRRVLVLDGDTVTELAGWPKDAPLRGWARLGDWVYGLVEAEDGTAVWRSDGMAVEQVAPARIGWQPRALAAGEGALWAVSAEGTADDPGGVVWRSGDGRTWERFRVVRGGRPSDVALHDGWLYVGGAGEGGSGALWGERLVSTQARASAVTAVLRKVPAHPDEADPRVLADRLGRAMADPESYRDYGEALRDLVFGFARQAPAPETWALLLDRSWPSMSQTHFSDGSAIPAETLGRWILLWGMSLAGTGAVPVDWLSEAWTLPVNPSEKYYGTAPGAIRAAGEIGQDDAATIGTLIARLDRQDDPLWLAGDVVGALTALTGERFAYDREAWRAWWREARANWPR